MANSILTFSITNLTVPSHYEFHRTTLANIDKTGAEALSIADLVGEYRTQIDVLFNVINRHYGSALSEEIREADQTRDGLLGEIFTIIDAATTSRLPGRSAHGDLLKVYVAPNRHIARYERTRESGSIHALLRDVSSPQAQEAIAALALTAHFDALAEANNRLGELTDERSTQTEIQAVALPTKTRPQRRLVDSIYRNIANKVNAAALVQPTDEITQFITNQNGTVMEFKRILG